MRKLVYFGLRLEGSTKRVWIICLHGRIQELQFLSLLD